MNDVVHKGVGWGVHKQRRDFGRIVFGSFKHSNGLSYTAYCEVKDRPEPIPVTIRNPHAMTLEEIVKEKNR